MGKNWIPDCLTAKAPRRQEDNSAPVFLACSAWRLGSLRVPLSPPSSLNPPPSTSYLTPSFITGYVPSVVGHAIACLFSAIHTEARNSVPY